MNELQPNSISSEAVDAKVLELLHKYGTLTRESLLYLLPQYHPVLVRRSIQRLLASESLGYSLIHSPSKENETEESHSPIHSPTPHENHSPSKENEGLYVRWRPAAGTAEGCYLYPYLYQNARCIAYIGGGNERSPVAQRRVKEIQGLIDREIVTAATPDEEIRRLVNGIKRRNGGSAK